MTIELKSCTYFRGDIALYHVEVSVTQGIGIHIVGMPDPQIRGCLLRVASAIQSLGYHLPGKKVVVRINKAVPVRVADGMYRPEVCTSFDLAIALGILIASGQVPAPAFPEKWKESLFFGSLSSTGEILLPFCGHMSELWNGINSAVIETLDWQLRATFDTIFAPDCPAINLRITRGFNNLDEFTAALKGGKI